MKRAMCSYKKVQESQGCRQLVAGPAVKSKSIPSWWCLLRNYVQD